MSFSTHIHNKKKDILVFLTAEKVYSINFTEKNKKFCLSLHYNGANSYLLLMAQKFTNLKQKILRL